MNQIDLIGKTDEQNPAEKQTINNSSKTIQQNRPKNLQISKTISDNQKWRQCKIIGKNVSIRSYSASCAFQGKFYVYGGYQILNGSLGDFYSIDLHDDQPKFIWNQIIPKNKVTPGPRSKHALVGGKNKIYLIGGLYQDVNSSNDIFGWDGLKQEWTQLKPEGIQKLPKIDSFGCVLIEKQGQQIIYIVGGYNGEKALMLNSVYEFNTTKNTIKVLFENIPSKKSKDFMHTRCGHAIASDGQNIYIFGGKNEDERFNDLWQFNLKTNKYEQLPGAGDLPSIRNGHTMNYYNSRLYVFGGIHDITWELDDLHIYNLIKKQWTTLEQDSPRRVEKRVSPDAREEKSVEKKGNKKKNWYQSVGGSLNPPNKSQYSSPANTGAPKNFATSYHTKQKTGQQQHQGNMLDQQRRKVFYQKKTQMLKTFQINEKQKSRYIQFQTTSQAMINSLDVIGNPSGKANMHQTDKLTDFGKESHSKFLDPLENNMNLVIGKKPCARDGHCSVMLGQELIIFSGDRHQMSFNDIYKLNFSLAQKEGEK